MHTHYVLLFMEILCGVVTTKCEVKELTFFSKLDEHAQRLKRKCFENHDYFSKLLYILINLLYILILLPGTSFKDSNEHILGTIMSEIEL